MIVFLGAIGSAVMAALVWGVAAAPLVLQLLEYIAAGFIIVALIRTTDNRIQAVPVK